VFNTQKLHYQPHSPILIAKVIYASYDERRRELEARLADWARITLEANLASSDLYLAAYAAFDFVKSFALTTKHRSFSEEREWRAIYVPERDSLGYLKGHLDYSVGPRGVEPKLKFKFGDRSLPRDGQPGEPVTTQKLSDILEFIMLGPSASSPLAQKAFIRMLQRNNKTDFAAIGQSPVNHCEGWYKSVERPHWQKKKPRTEGDSAAVPERQSRRQLLERSHRGFARRLVYPRAARRS
jgi:hypothetical protein